MSPGGEKLRLAKESVRAAQKKRTDERVAYYRRLEKSPHGSSAVEIEAPPSSKTTGVWQAVSLGPDNYIWSRILLSGKEEWFTASTTTSGDFELRHSTI